MNNEQLIINEALVRQLVTSQFPQWKNLTVTPVERQGWDNRTFRLGDNMLVRLPSSSDYAAQVEKEQRWLPKLAPMLPLAVPVPLHLGEPAYGYPWKWSIYRWLDGETAAVTPIANQLEFAAALAQFLLAFQSIDATEGPLPGLHSFYRGGNLKIYAAETKEAIKALDGKIDAKTATEVWKTALSTSWSSKPVWVHGDISAGNLLLQNGQLNAVIDFGQLTTGDPACDLVIAWTLFDDESRKVFRETLPPDQETWERGRAWALWKALITAAGLINTNNVEGSECWRIINTILADRPALEAINRD